MRRIKIYHGFLPAGFSTAASVIGVGASIAGQLMNYSAQQKAADIQAQQQAIATQQRNDALRLEREAAQQRLMEEQEKLSREMFAANLANQKQKSRAEAAAASAGVTGASVDALMSEFDMKMGLFNESNLRQRQILENASDLQMRGISQQYVSDITRINQPIARPSAFGLALGVGGTLLNSKLFDKKTS